MKRPDSVVPLLDKIVSEIDSDIVPALELYKKRDCGGFLSIPRQIFCLIDYLGALTDAGTNSTTSAVAYIENYLGRVNNGFFAVSGG